MGICVTHMEPNGKYVKTFESFFSKTCRNKKNKVE